MVTAMRALIIAGVLFLLHPGRAFADVITDYRVSTGTGPNGELVVISTAVWNDERPEVIKEVWSRWNYEEYYYVNGEWQADKGHRTTFYEAYPRPAKAGFLLVKMEMGYEYRGIVELTLIDTDRPRHEVPVPSGHCFDLYWLDDKLVLRDPLDPVAFQAFQTERHVKSAKSVPITLAPATERRLVTIKAQCPKTRY